jgi:isoquinoline 1-oxidoreductase beta subunit
VHLPLVGGGFGRRLSNDYVSEAVGLSKAIGGPVQVLWTRDDDMRHDNYRPMTYHVMKGALDGNGNIVAYYQQALTAGGRGRGAGFNNQLPVRYAIPNGGSLGGGIESPVPTGAWRSVDATFMGFVTECFFDELCALGKKDPVEARLALSSGRIKDCVRLAAEKSGWGKPLPAGWGRGIAVYDSFGSIVAHVAEVEVKKDGSVRVHRVVSAVGCGTVVNPLGARAQIEGAILDGISCLFYAQITIADGGAAESSWREFGWARMPDAPKIEVHFLPSQDSPSGLGEPGFPPAGPAVANAIFAACGKRIRKVPFGGKVA